MSGVDRWNKADCLTQTNGVFVKHWPGLKNKLCRWKLKILLVKDRHKGRSTAWSVEASQKKKSLGSIMTLASTTGTGLGQPRGNKVQGKGLPVTCHADMKWEEGYNSTHS